MWFKRKKKKDQGPSPTQIAFDELEAFRKVGETFQYLGTTMMVTRHWEITRGFHGMPDIRPCLVCDYADKNGVIHQASFGTGELRTLRQENLEELKAE